MSNSSQQRTISSLTDTEIQRFCAGCQNLRENEVCYFGRYDQMRYVARNLCGYARKDGKRGDMTKEGFKPFDR